MGYLTDRWSCSPRSGGEVTAEGSALHHASMSQRKDGPESLDALNAAQQAPGLSSVRPGNKTSDTLLWLNMNADLEERDDELLALQSIFASEEFVRNELKAAGEIRVCVELPADFTVVLKEGKYKQSGSDRCSYVDTSCLLIIVNTSFS